MDPVTAIGLASAVIQLLDFGLKVAERLTEYVELGHGETPKSLESIATRLPLLFNALSTIKSESKLRKYDQDTRTILHGVVLGCLKLAQELNEISKKIHPQSGEKIHLKLKKVLSSLKNEERMSEIDRGLQAYIQLLILHQVVSSDDMHITPLDEVDYFEVKEKRVKDPVSRAHLVSQLHQLFFKAARSQCERPEYVVLQGKEGVGKSQVALMYCDEAYDLGHFHTVFWLDASSPKALRLGLESAASLIRHTKVGTQKEKLDFLHQFLSERWHPWLLVLDNYNHKAFDTDPLTGLLPKSGHGAVLVTTQDSDLPDMNTVVKVYKFLTKNEDLRIRRTVSDALRTGHLDPIIDAISEGFDVNSYSATVWKDVHQPVLNLAAEVGFEDAARLFLDMGADIHLDKLQGSALHSAAYGGSLPVVTLCLDYEDNMGLSYGEEELDSTIRYAISKGHNDILKTLIKRRGDYIDLNRRWPVEGFGEAAEAGHLETLRLLLSHNKFPKPGPRLANALAKAARWQQLEVAKFLLSEAHVDPDTINEDRAETALAYVVSSLDREDQEQIRETMMTLLLDAGASPSLCDHRRRNTPLHHAATSGLTSSVILLLDRGADPTIENDDNETPLEDVLNTIRRCDRDIPTVSPLASVKIADPDVHTKYYKRALFLAIEHANLELALLALKQIDVNAAADERTGDTSLLAAIRRGAQPVARLLLRSGARTDLPDKDGRMPLLLAAATGMDLIIKDLVKAQGPSSLEERDAGGNTPLILAVNGKHERAVRVLVKLGADVDAMGRYGETALDVAEEKRLDRIAMILEGVALDEQPR